MFSGVDKSQTSLILLKVIKLIKCFYKLKINLNEETLKSNLDNLWSIQTAVILIHYVHFISRLFWYAITELYSDIFSGLRTEAS